MSGKEKEPLTDLQQEIINTLKGIEEAKEFGKQIGEQLPGEVEEIFNSEAMPVWRNMWAKFGVIWENTITVWIDSIVEKLTSLVGRQLDGKGTQLQEEFKKEKAELKEELKNEAEGVVDGIWERFKSLLFNSKNEEM